MGGFLCSFEVVIVKDSLYVYRCESVVVEQVVRRVATVVCFQQQRREARLRAAVEVGGGSACRSGATPAESPHNVEAEPDRGCYDRYYYY